MSGSSISRYPAFRDLSPAGQAATIWYRHLGRALKACRLYRRENPIVIQIREHLFTRLTNDLRLSGPWRFRITPVEIFLVDEPVVHPTMRDEESTAGQEEILPFLFYRDGIRGLTFFADMPQTDFDALFHALLATGRKMNTHEDLVTLMWQANTVRIQIEAVPLSQTIFLSSRRASGAGGDGGEKGHAFTWSPAGEELRADIGQIEGMAQGLHRDTFDDWPLPSQYVDVPTAYAALTRGMQFVRTMLLTEWAAERGTDWTQDAPQVVRMLLQMDPSDETRAALSHATVTWVVGAMQRASWQEAQQALVLAREIDPDGSRIREPLNEGMAELDLDVITEALDEAAAEDQASFFALIVALGAPAISLAFTVMAKAGRARTRAAASTMLGYLCGDSPELLVPYLTDEHWYVVRNVVFVLGQIGGPAVVPMLEAAAQHPETRVRRQVVQALANVPRDAQLPILASQLGTKDPQLLSASLNLLTREKDPRVTRILLRQIEAADFESRRDEIQRALFAALGEVAGDDAVSNLEAMLHKGGWFARPTLQRTASARTLQLIGTERATAALESALQSKSEAVRNACLDAMSMKGFA